MSVNEIEAQKTPLLVAQDGDSQRRSATPVDKKGLCLSMGILLMSIPALIGA